MIIKSPSRLHLTLIDMNGSYGRIDGGIGLTIKDPNFVLYGEPAEKGITVDFKLCPPSTINPPKSNENTPIPEVPPRPIISPKEYPFE